MTLVTNWTSKVFLVTLLEIFVIGTLGYPTANVNSNSQIDHRRLKPAGFPPVKSAAKAVQADSAWKPVTSPQLDAKKPQFFKPQAPKMHNDAVFDPILVKVKTVNQQKQPPPKPNKAKLANARKSVQRQNDDDDDDDDDDGGEYGGASDDSCKKKGDKKSMPMMIIRGFDVMAMDMPVANGKKECKKPRPAQETGPDDVTGQPPDEEPQDTEAPAADTEEQTQAEDSCSTTEAATTAAAGCDARMGSDARDRDAAWGDWSSCSQSCGVGMQSRSRLRPSGVPERDTEFRACHVADCPAESQGYRTKLKN